MGYTRSPHWLSSTRRPAASKMHRFDITRPSRLAVGYPAAPASRVPSTSAVGSARAASSSRAASAGSCCPSVSIVTAWL